jgi:2-C-methyl-D-erythritol 4-phosphate cytidylyltransferase
MKHIAILLAGGSSKRMRQPGKDKLLHPIKETNAFRLCYKAFTGSLEIENIVIVYRDEDQKALLKKEIVLVHQESQRNLKPVFTQGGKERMHSVANALANCPESCEFVYIHDCARPMITSATIDQLKNIVSKEGAAVIARPLHDTVKKILDFAPKKNTLLSLTETVDREKLWIMETPQCSNIGWLKEGIKIAKEKNILVTDEVSILELVEKPVSLVNINYPNPKITAPADLTFINFLLSQT